MAKYGHHSKPKVWWDCLTRVQLRRSRMPFAGSEHKEKFTLACGRIGSIVPLGIS